jgi:hypothetical protein
MTVNPLEISLKLFFTWLLGVPVLVLAMVVARAMSPYGLQVAQRDAPAAQVAARPSVCVRQDQLHQVRPLVTKNGKRTACNRRPVK